MTIIERLFELNKPACDERVEIRRHDEDTLLASGPMSFEPRDSDGDFIFTVGGVSFTANDVTKIDDEAQTVWLQAPACNA